MSREAAYRRAACVGLGGVRWERRRARALMRRAVVCAILGVYIYIYIYIYIYAILASCPSPRAEAAEAVWVVPALFRPSG